jgi:hypothetical protein
MSSPPKGPPVLCPFGGEEYCGVGGPSVPNYTNSLVPTVWKDSQPYGDKEANLPLVHQDEAVTIGHFVLRKRVASSEAPFGGHRPGQPAYNIQLKLSSYPDYLIL